MDSQDLKHIRVPSPFFSMAEMSAPAVENHDPDSPSGRLLSFDAADLSDLGKQLGTLSIRPCARRPGASITASLQGRSTGSAWLTGSSGRSRSSLTHRRHPSTDQRGRGMRRFRNRRVTRCRLSRPVCLRCNGLCTQACDLCTAGRSQCVSKRVLIPLRGNVPHTSRKKGLRRTLFAD